MVYVVVYTRAYGRWWHLYTLVAILNGSPWNFFTISPETAFVIVPFAIFTTCRHRYISLFYIFIVKIDSIRDITSNTNKR